MKNRVVVKIFSAVFHLLWVGSIFLLVVVASQLLVGRFASAELKTWLSSPLGGLVQTAVLYALMALVVILPLIRRFWGSWRELYKSLGLSGGSVKQMVIWVLYVWGLYFVASFAVTVMLYSLAIPGLDLEQQQVTGFEGLQGVSEYVAAFVALVVVAPVFEEIVFRGYLFGRLRETSGFWTSAILTSALFAFFHMQLNVMIDVFVLSLFLCFLRERFQSIWAGVLLHAFKNGFAYVLLFILPLYGIHLVK